MSIRPLRPVRGFILAVACLPLVSGCVSATLSAEDAARGSRLVVVPVESPPALVMAYTRGEAAGLLVGGGIVGIAVREGVTRDSRREVAARLNEVMQDWWSRRWRRNAPACCGPGASDPLRRFV